jgi:hypothetical protein
MVQSLLLDFLLRIAVGLGAVLALIAIVGLGIPPRKTQAVRSRLRQ